MDREWQRALQLGLVDELKVMLDNGADVNALDEHGQTSLMFAARQGQSEVVSLLVSHGANLDHTAKYHLSALMLAVINGHVDVVDVLVKSGADQSIRGTGAPGFFNKTALDLAQASGNDAIVARLSRA